MYPWLLPIWSSLSEKTHARCFGKLASDAGVGLPERRRDLHKAKLLIASLRGGSSWQCLLPYSAADRNHRKQRQKGISAYAPSPLPRLSNKRGSFNLVTTGAFLCRWLCRHFWRGKLARRPTSPDERSDLVSIQFMCNTQSKKKKKKAFLRTESIIFRTGWTAGGQKLVCGVASLLLAARIASVVWSPVRLHGNWLIGNCFP